MRWQSSRRVSLCSPVHSHLAPGGYYEQAEVSHVVESTDENDIFHFTSDLANRAFEKFGKRLLIAPFLKQMITDAGFVDVVEVEYQWPIGDWPEDQRLNDIGKWNAQHWLEGIDAWSMRVLTQYMGVGEAVPACLLHQEYRES